MFGTKNAGPSAALRKTSEHLFTTVGDLIRQGQQAGQLPPGDPERLRLLLVATLQGIAALITSGRVRAGQIDALVANAVALHPRPALTGSKARTPALFGLSIVGWTPRGRELHRTIKLADY